MTGCLTRSFWIRTLDLQTSQAFRWVPFCETVPLILWGEHAMWHHGIRTVLFVSSLQSPCFDNRPTHCDNCSEMTQCSTSHQHYWLVAGLPQPVHYRPHRDGSRAGKSSPMLVTDSSTSGYFFFPPLSLVLDPNPILSSPPFILTTNNVWCPSSLST